MADGTGLHPSTKLPNSAAFAPGQRPPVDLLCDWIDESYRSIAPKTLVRHLPEWAAAAGGAGGGR